MKEAKYAAPCLLRQLRKLGRSQAEGKRNGISLTDRAVHAADALSKMGDKRAVMPLVHYMTKDPNVGFVETLYDVELIVDILGQLGDERALKVLKEFNILRVEDRASNRHFFENSRKKAIDTILKNPDAEPYDKTRWFSRY